MAVENLVAEVRKDDKTLLRILDEMIMLIPVVTFARVYGYVKDRSSCLGHENGGLAMTEKIEADDLGFQSILQDDVPKGRDGKHKRIVTQLLKDIDRLAHGTALKVPLSALPDSKENIRSALNRATRQKGIEVATSSDAEYLYIWKVELQKP